MFVTDGGNVANKGLMSFAMMILAFGVLRFKVNVMYIILACACLAA